MAQQIKAPTAKSDTLSSTPGPTWWKERAIPYKLSSTSTHAPLTNVLKTIK